MARPQRNNVDYFPFYCKEGKVMYFIEQKYGNDGYATWIKILRQLAVTNFHYLNMADKAEFMFLSSKCRVSEQLLNEIINDLCELGEFHKELWHENRIIFNEKLVESISDAYTKRNSNVMTLHGLFLLLQGLGIRKPIKGGQSSAINPQSRVEDIKEKKTKGFSADDFVKKINEIYSRHYRVSAKVKEKFNARVNSGDYSIQTLIDVANHIKLSTYHIGTQFNYATPEFILREDTIEKYKHSPIIQQNNALFQKQPTKPPPKFINS